jgi:hypothetical protein
MRAVCTIVPFAAADYHDEEDSPGNAPRDNGDDYNDDDDDEAARCPAQLAINTEEARVRARCNQLSPVDGETRHCRQS